MKRGFEVVKEEFRKHKGVDIKLPTRGSKGSAGYDFYSTKDFLLKKGETIMLWTDVKACMLHDEVLLIYVRSSMGAKGLNLTNNVGVIDSTYYSNISNDGNIGMKLKNAGDEDIYVKTGDRLAQGVFSKFLVTSDDDDKTLPDRVGGYGSTNKQ